MEGTALVEGQTLLHGGRYRFLRRIGSGTFASILCAMDLRSGRLVAIKCVQSAAFRPAAEREAAVLRHVNARDPAGSCAVVRLLDAFEEQQRFYLVLELLGDAVLDVARWGPWRRPLQRLEPREPQHKLHSSVPGRRGASSPPSTTGLGPQADSERAVGAAPALSLQQIRQMAVHLSAALAFLHDQGLIHADVKPENVVRSVASTATRSGSTASSWDLNSSGSSPVKLIDFGNCVDLKELAGYRQEFPQQWAAEAAVGFDIQTLTYRAPEVAAGVSITPAIDLWSLGCVLVECATGLPLFTTAPSASTSTNAEPEGNSVANRQLLRQIENAVNGGESLGTTCKAYQFAACYVTSSATQLASERSQLPPAQTLQNRLSAVCPDDSSGFHDFMRRLLDVHPDTRLKAREALLHPFVQGFFPFQLLFSSREPAASLGASPPHKTPRKRRRRSLPSPPVPAVITDIKEESVKEEQPSPQKLKRLKKHRESERRRRKGLRQALKLIPKLSNESDDDDSSRASR